MKNRNPNEIHLLAQSPIESLSKRKVILDRIIEEKEKEYA